MMLATVHGVLDFWFVEASTAHWFVADAAFDAQIRERFASTMTAAAEGCMDGWAVKPSGWLALLILLDQFPRNLYRGDSRAWAQDASAQRIALSGIARGHDRQLPPVQRVFAYLPLEHAEDRLLQQQSVALFEVLCAEVPSSQRVRFEEFLDYACRHREVIARFGRFPHRNAVLGRTSTAEEIVYLGKPGSGF